MKSFLILSVALLFIASCAQTQSKNIPIPAAVKTTPSANEAVATFGEGCFWHAEIVFQSLAGVRDAVSGYAGGTGQHPSYEEVCSGETGHAETVQVYYDPAVVSYQTLVDAFFGSQDPTTLNSQGPDEGTQYRSIAFYRNEKEKSILEASIQKLTNEKKFSDKIVTQVVPYINFYPAEDYHQEYILNNPHNPYVEHVSIPDYLEFRKSFKGRFK